MSNYLLFFVLPHRYPISILLPYTTLFRSLYLIHNEKNGKEKVIMNQKNPKDTQNFITSKNHVKNILKNTNITGQDKIIECPLGLDRKSTRLNSSHVSISYAVFCLIKKTIY